MKDDHPEILLLARIISGQTAPEDVEPAAWDGLIQLATRHGLFPILYEQIASASIPLELNMRRNLKIRKIRHLEKSKLLDNAVADITRALDAADLPNLWLKGAALAHTAYPASWLRPMVDLDVLVPRPQKEVALSVAQSAGYRLTTDKTGNVLRSDYVSNNYALRGGINRQVALELHYDLVKPRLGPLTENQLNWFWDQSRVVTTSIGELRILKAEAMLLHLAVHDIWEHEAQDISHDSDEAWKLLRRKYDTYMVLRSEPIDWELMLTGARKLNWSYPLAQSLKTAHYYFGAEIPSAIQETLEQDLALTPQHDPPIRLQGSEVQVIRHWQRFRRMPFPIKLRYIQTALFPDREKMRMIYGLSEIKPDWLDYARLLLQHYLVVLRLFVKQARAKVTS